MDTQPDALPRSFPRPAHTCPASLRVRLTLQRPPFTAYPARDSSDFSYPTANARDIYFPNGRSARRLLSASCHISAEQYTEWSLNCRFGKIRQRPFRSVKKLTFGVLPVVSRSRLRLCLIAYPESATSIAPKTQVDSAAAKRLAATPCQGVTGPTPPLG